MKSVFVNCPLSILLLSLLFAVKALYLAFSITPLWDIPDETGHFAYVRDLADGNGIPLLGDSKIGADIESLAAAGRQRPPALNWIAQHPPAYYIIAAIPLKVARSFTKDEQTLFRLPRIIAALSGALSLLVVFRILGVFNVEKQSAIAIASAIGFIPMFSHLASGTNHDITLFLFCAIATYYFVHYVKNSKRTDAYLCAAWLAIAGATKMTAWVLICPMVIALVFEFNGELRARFRHAAGIALTAVSLPTVWMLRNMFYFGNPLYTAVNDNEMVPTLIEPLQSSFTFYISQFPILEDFVRHFYGLVGWAGAGDGIRMIQVGGWPSIIFASAIITATLIIAIQVTRLSISNLSATGPGCIPTVLANTRVENRSLCCRGRWVYLGAILLGIVFAGLVLTISAKHTSLSGGMHILAIALLVFSSAAALPLIFFTTNPEDRCMFYGLVIAAFFIVVVLYQTYGIYLDVGYPRGIQGRYFYPIVPLLISSFTIALSRLQISGNLVAMGVVLLACAELQAFLNQIIPFYDRAGL
ncbi:glycosyltransferase family 39 protein [bacterium]|nr:glycosyltransferase family 39 protein [bacterium]